MFEFPDLTLTQWVLSFLIAFVAGLIKGAVGFALPLVMVSGLSSIMDPKLALAGLIVSVVATNGMQVVRAGWAEASDAARLHWRYLLMVWIGILGAAQLVPAVPSQVFYFILGVPVVILSIIQLAGWTVKIAPHRRQSSEWWVGAFSGIMGGLAGTWGPITVLFLLAIDLPKARQMAVQGVIYGSGAVMLFIGHTQSGIFNAATAPFSASLLLPAVIGMQCGFWLQDRMDQALFRRVTLIVLTIAGLNLLRKGMVGF